MGQHVGQYLVPEITLPIMERDDKLKRVFSTVKLTASLTGLSVCTCFFVLGFLCFMLKTGYGEDSTTHNESNGGKLSSQMIEEEPKQPQEAESSSSKLVSHGWSMPSLPTSLSHCSLYDDSVSCSNLNAGLTGFQELPALLNCTQTKRNRMNDELSYAIASAKSRRDLSEKNGTANNEGLAQLDEDGIDLLDSPYEVVLDIRTPL